MSKKISSRRSEEIIIRGLVREIALQEGNRKTPKRTRVPSIYEGMSRRDILVIEEIRRQRVLTEAFIASRGVQRLMYEHRTFLMEQEMTVGDVLASFDEAVNDMDNSMMEFMKQLLEFVKEYAPDNIKQMIEKGEKVYDAVTSKIEDIEQITEWFTDFKDMAKDLFEAVKEAKKKHANEIKKQLQWMWSEKKETMEETFEHVKGLKDMYENNETFKLCVDKVFGEAFKKTMIKLIEQAIKLIPYGDKLVAGAKIVMKVIEVGGKIRDLFGAFRKAKATPAEKFADFAEKVVKGPDNKELGAIGKALQLDDNLESTIDDKVEARFIKDYLEMLKAADPKTPLRRLNANKLITKFIEKEKGGTQVAAAAA